MRPSGPRDPVAGPDSGPEPPYPIRLSGEVIKGFGRGSKELGIPTANIPSEALEPVESTLGSGGLPTGVYYGVVTLDPGRFSYKNSIEKGESSPAEEEKTKKPTILPAVLSIGYNPFYKNEVKSIEIHIMAPLYDAGASPEGSTDGSRFFKLPDFYGTQLKLLILGYIRPEYDYVSREALIDDISVDCQVARASLARDKYRVYLGGSTDDNKVLEQREWLTSFS